MGNFWGRKLSWIGEKCNFHEENFRGLLPLPCQRIPCLQISQRKLLWIATKLRNLWEFSPSKVARYTLYKLSSANLKSLNSSDCFDWEMHRLWLTAFTDRLINWMEWTNSQIRTWSREATVFFLRWVVAARPACHSHPPCPSQQWLEWGRGSDPPAQHLHSTTSAE